MQQKVDPRKTPLLSPQQIQMIRRAAAPVKEEKKHLSPREQFERLFQQTASAAA